MRFQTDTQFQSPVKVEATVQKRAWRSTFLASALLAQLAVPSATFAADPPPAPADVRKTIQSILPTIRYWKAKGRDGKVVELWQSVLKIDPKNVTALSELAILEIKAGNTGAANGYVNTLESLDPKNPAIARLRQGIELGGKFPVLLQQARDLIKVGKTAEGVAKFREAFGQSKPEGRVALEFYQTLSGLPGGWQEAREGLERLVQSHPGDKTMELALAKHLTYNETTRRQGIQRLHALATDPLVGKPAREAWRTALGWLHASTADVEYFTQYMSAVGDDSDLQTRVNELENEKERAVADKKKPAQNLEIATGFNLLNHAKGREKTAKLDQAASYFQRAIGKRQKASLGHLGMAVLELRKEEPDLEKATREVEEARRLAPRSRTWVKTAEAIAFTRLMADASAHLYAGEYTLAERDYLDAQNALNKQTTRGKQDWTTRETQSGWIRMGLANVYAATGKYEPALALYRELAEPSTTRPANQRAEAQRSLVALLLRMQRLDDAAAANAKLRNMDSEKSLSPSVLEAEGLRAQAMAARTRGNEDEAVTLLTKAMQTDAQDYWSPLELAYIYLARGELDTARAMLDRVAAMRTAEKTLDARKRAALIVARAVYLEYEYPDEPVRALESLNQIAAKDVKDWPEDARHLRRTLETRIAITNAKKTAPAGGLVKALRSILATVQDDPELTMQLCVEVAKAGGADTVTGPAKKAVSMALPSQHAGLALEYAYVLLEADELNEMANVLQQLEDDPTLSPRSRADLQKLTMTLAVKQAHQAREDGDLAKAFAIVAKVCRNYPTTCKGLHARTGTDYDATVAFLTQAVRRDPHDYWSWLELAYTHMDRGEPEAAAAILDRLAQADKKEKPRLDPKQRTALLMASAIFLSAKFPDEPERALDVLMRIDTKDPLDWPADAQRLKRRLETEIALREAEAHVAAGGDLRALDAVMVTVQDDPELVMLVAVEMARLGGADLVLGQAQRAVVTARPGVRQQLRLQLASILLEAGKLGEMAGVLRDIANNPTLTPRAKAELQRLNVALVVKQASVAVEEHEQTRAFAILNRAAHEYPESLEVQVGLGNLHNSAGEYREGLAIFQALLKRSLPESQELQVRQGAVVSLAGMLEEGRAQQVIRDGLAHPWRQPLNGVRMQVIAARFEATQGDTSEANKMLNNALEETRKLRDLKPLPPPEQGMGTEATATELKLANTKNERVERVPPREVETEETEIVGALVDNGTRTAPWIRADGYLRYRDGEGGLGRLTEIGLIALTHLSFGSGGMVELMANPVSADAGTLNLGEPTVFRRFGQLANVATLPGGNFAAQSQTGAALGARIGWKPVSLAVSSTPLGFTLTTLTGEVEAHGTLGRLEVQGRLRRDSVKDSLLSWAGVRDPISGVAWGQITANGGELNASFEDGKFSFFLYASVDEMLGTHVPNNRRIAGGAGIRGKLGGRGGAAFKTGLTLAGMGYQSNLRYFTFGQGGYFSPQTFVHASVPAEFSYRAENLYFELGADAGINYLREDVSDFFPVDSNLQAILRTRTDANGQALPVSFAAQSAVGPAFNAKLKLDYDVSNEISTGLYLHAHTAVDYREAFGLVYLRYRFAPTESAYAHGP